MYKTNTGWLFKMALRDSRKNRSRLLLFISSVIFGIAALVAIYSFGYDLQNNITSQAAELIGADMSVYSNNQVDSSMMPLIDSLGDEKSMQQSFASMVLFPKSKGTRLVNVRALQGGFPYYGSLETAPQSAAASFRHGRKALVDATLMLQFNAVAGDSIKLGDVTFKIEGELKKAPGQTGIASSVAPVVYIPLQYLAQTGLSKTGSRIRYTYFYKYNKPVNMQALIKSIGPRLEKADLRYETVEMRKESTGRFFSDLTRFLSLVGFIALLLGCVGVASAMQVYIKEKISTIAIMRCLGVTGKKAFLIYLVQVVCIGFIGSVIGAFAGTFIQTVLPLVMKDFLPFEIKTTLSWLAVGQGVALGVIISVLFALLPLLSIRKISPLFTLRMSYEQVNTARDPFRLLVYLLITLFIAGFTYLQLKSIAGSVFFTIGIIAAFLLLTAVAWLLMRFIRLIIRSSWSYIVRQGFANLYRPNNQTIILILSIGLSTAFICTLFFVQDILTKQLVISGSANQSNMILFDIQTNQQQAIANLTRQQGLPIIQQVPIITVHVDEINGKTEAQAKNDSAFRPSPWLYNNELRITYRDSLTGTEKITEGKWIGKALPGEDLVPVSLDEGYARSGHLRIGDTIVFNVQGTNIASRIASFRKVEWNRVQTNFRCLFPAGVLENAPQFHVLLTRVPSSRVSVKYQQSVVQQFPNVSIIDLGLVLAILDELLNKIGYVIHFMAAFSIITGLVVLVASVRISKYQRIQESIL
ncbi:MAG TPA: ABC transporter permease, partial [Chitinophagaceae bacterium]|nr:ABC transporter permease [Chitinophagaceae bacterium]